MLVSDTAISEGLIWSAIDSARQALATALGVPPTSIIVSREGVADEIKISWTLTTSLPSAEDVTPTSNETESGH